MSDTLPIIRVVTHRSDGDCAIAALAMYLGLDYEDILAVATHVTKQQLLHRRGMWTKHIQQTADSLGVSLVVKRKFDLDTADGILLLKSHVAVLRDGMVIDTDGTIWDADVYVSQKQKVTGLLTKES